MKTIANINIGKNVVPFVIFIGLAIVGCVLFHKSLKDIQGKSPVDLWKLRKAKYEAWRDGKTNQVPLSGNDNLYRLRQTAPIAPIIDNNAVEMALNAVRLYVLLMIIHPTKHNTPLKRMKLGKRYIWTTINGYGSCIVIFNITIKVTSTR